MRLGTALGTVGGAINLLMLRYNLFQWTTGFKIYFGILNDFHKVQEITYR